MIEKKSSFFIAGINTFIGKALERRLGDLDYREIVNHKSAEPDLTDPAAVSNYFEQMRPEFVFLVAGKSGGIQANQKYPADLIYDNLSVALHIIHSANRFGVKKLLYLASSCSYPKKCPQPMRIESLMSGPLESTNEAYATAKLAGIQLCQSYRRQYDLNTIVAIPANPFGPEEDFDLEDSHVIAALIRKMEEAKQSGVDTVEIWGTGEPRREFIYVDDLADACIFSLSKYEGDQPINLGNGFDLSIRELAEYIREIIGFNGQLSFNTKYPDGMYQKLLDSSHLLSMGWKPRYNLRDALKKTYEWFVKNKNR
jgi:GDP-L-fucose synthase